MSFYSGLAFASGSGFGGRVMARRVGLRTPKQQRSMESVEAIVEAAARILIQDGYTALNTNRIAKVAGVSVGTLYQYFPNKEAVVHALVDTQANAMIEAFTVAIQGLLTEPDRGPDGGVSALLDATLATMRVRPELMRRLLLEAPRGGRGDVDRLWRQRYHELVRAALWERRDSVRGGDIDLMSYVMVTGAYAVFLDALAHRPELLGTDALRDELHTLVVRYLEP
jgi:AcrR family transcriptional regulator